MNHPRKLSLLVGLTLPLFAACESMRDVGNGLALGLAGAIDIANGDTNASATRAVGSTIMDRLDRENSATQEDDATSDDSPRSDASKLADESESDSSNLVSQAATASNGGKERSRLAAR